MSITLPDVPAWLQNGVYPARLDRRVLEAVFPSEGVVNGLAVSQRAAGANFSVDIAAGQAAIAGGDQSAQGTYVASTSGTLNLVIDPPDTQARLDVVYIAVRDPQAGGPAGDNGIIGKARGTPSGVTPLPVPAIPATAVELARVTVSPGATSITTVNIDQTRRAAAYAGGPASSVARFANRTARAAALPNPALGQVSVLDDWPGSLHVWDGTRWMTEQSGSPFTTTNSDAVVYLNFPQPFQAIPEATVFQGDADSGYGGHTIVVAPIVRTPTYVGVIFRGINHSATPVTLLVSQQVTFHWRARGPS